MFPHSIFKAYDIRGIFQETLTTDVAHAIGQAIGSELRSQGLNTIIIGRDGRLSGPALSQALSDGLRASGVEVTDIGVATSPMVYYACHALDIRSCVAITGSHNPPNYNGFKIVINGVTLAGDAIQSLKQRVLDKDYACGNGDYRSVAILERYVSEIASDVKAQRKLKVVIDCGNGVAGVCAGDIYRAMGCEVTELYCDVDGEFPNHHPDPSEEANLEDLIHTVVSQGADIGLAFDGDGDRLGVVTSQGKVIWPDRQLILFARDILARRPGSEIIYDIKCSRTLSEEINAAGGKATMWKTGHSLIKAKMQETKAELAGEMSGHLYFKERWYGFDDGVYSGARLIEILSQQTGSSDEVFATVPETVSTPEIKIELGEGENHQFMLRFIDSAKFEGAQINTIDGIRADFSDGFGLVRASNTTPVLVLRFEGDTSQALERIKQHFKAQITLLLPQIELPF